MIELDQCMKADHFKDWFCGSLHCPYSKESQVMARVQVQSILKAQEAAGMAVDANNSSSTYIPWSRSMMWLNTIYCAHTDSAAPEGTEHNDNKTQHPGLPLLQHTPSPKLRSPTPDASPSAERADTPALASQQAPGPAPALDLTALSPAVAKRAKELLEEIAEIAAKDTSNTWYMEEEELLRLLRQSNVPYPQIEAVSIRSTDISASSTTQADGRWLLL
jgi:hypothetical protein